MALGLLTIIFPIRLRSDRVLITLVGAGIVIRAIALLPVSWMGNAGWRMALGGADPIPLGACFSPQPWITLEGCLLLSLTLWWALALFSENWSKQGRLLALQIYLVGILALSGAAWIVKIRRGLAGITSEGPVFGFFPNRNQSADLFALAAVAAFGLMLDCIRRKDWVRVVPWAIALGGLVGSVIAIGSRAGVLLLGLGTCGSLVGWIVIRPWKRTPGYVMGAFATALAAFLIVGGIAVERLIALAGNLHGLTSDFRWKIYTAALAVSRDVGWRGVGLGNFEPVFASVRLMDTHHLRILHPESDWLWAVVEMGWPAAGWLLACVIWFFWRTVPWENGSDRMLRLTCLICVLGFIGHSCVDVSGHRLGAVWPALFLASLALHVKPGTCGAPRRNSGITALGVVLCLLGSAWLQSGRATPFWPTTATIDYWQSQIDAGVASHSPGQAILACNQYLKIAPLSWRAWFLRGSAELALGKGANQREAGIAFERARSLEPNSSELRFQEGQSWLAANPWRAMEIWASTLSEFPAEDVEMFKRMLTAAKDHPTISRTLRSWSHDSPDRQIAYLERAVPIELESEMAELSQGTELDRFSAEQRERLFAIWFAKGDRRALLEGFAKRPQWMGEHWRWAAQLLSFDGQLEKAFAIARARVIPPAIPEFAQLEDVEAASREFSEHPEDPVRGFRLYLAEARAHNEVEALRTLEKLRTLPGAPSFLNFLAADHYARLKMWPSAWQSLSEYLAMRP